MEQNQSSSQIKANPITSQTIKDTEISDKSETFIAEDQNKGYKKSKLHKPDFIYCCNNKSIEELIKTYPHLKSLQESQTINFEEIKQAESFVIRSNNDDDIHKAIKYGVWSSTPPNNEMLNETYNAAQAQGKDIYLFYSVVKSGQFVGVAKLKSGFIDETFAYWWQHSKWRGLFKIEWLFVKDIPYKFFENLKNTNDMPVIRSKDGTKINWEQTGLPMIKVYQSFKDNDQNIFQDFEHMDQREQFQRYIKSTNFQNMNHQYGGYQQQMYKMPAQNYYYPAYQYQQMSYYQPKMSSPFPPTYHNNYKGGQQGQNYYNQNGQGFKKYNKNRQNGGYYKYNKGYNKHYNNNNNNNNNNYQQQQPNGSQQQKPQKVEENIQN